MVFSSKRNGQRTEEQSTSSSASPSPAPSTISPSPAPPVVSLTTSEENEVLDPMIDRFNLAKNASEVAQDAFGPLKAAFGATARVLTIVRAAVANDKAWEEFMGTLEAHRGILEQNRRLLEQRKRLSQLTPVDSELVKALEDYETALNRIGKRAEQSAGRFKKKDAKSYLMQLLTSKTQSEIITRLTNDLNRSWEFLQARINLSMRTTMRVEEYLARMSLSQTLQLAQVPAYSVDKLLPGTRTNIIQNISTWADDNSSGKQIFWLCDSPGMGKSTIATHMGIHWHQDGRLAGIVSFPKWSAHSSHYLGQFSATIARQIIDLRPAGEQYILSLPQDVLLLPFQDQFGLLVKSLIEYVSPSPNKAIPAASEVISTASSSWPLAPLFIVIDGIDQCEEAEQVRLLDALFSGLPATSLVKVLLTSTPLHNIHHPLFHSNQILKSEVCHHLSLSNRKDIELYLKSRLEGEITSAQQNELIDACNGVILEVALLCDTLEKSTTPLDPAATIRNGPPHPTMARMYHAILDEIRKDHRERGKTLTTIRLVLQTMVLACCPIGIATYHALVPDLQAREEHYMNEVISSLKGILKVQGDLGEGPVYVLHPTFRTYLLGVPFGEAFHINARAGHALMANRCLSLLENLDFDWYGDAYIPHPGLPISNPPKIPQEVLEGIGTDTSMPLRYAMVFFARHVAKSLSENNVRNQLVAFFQTQLLAWIGWGSALMELPACINGLEYLRDELKTRVNGDVRSLDETALKWCEDAIRFIQCHQSIISQSFLHVRYSALAFDQHRSLVRDHYQASAIHSVPTVNGHLLAFHTSHVTSIAFSKHGDVIASADADLFIFLWHGDTREHTGGFLSGHKSRITSMAFSPDGKLLASGSTDGAIAFWPLGEVLGETSGETAILRQTGSTVACIAFSDDSDGVICGHSDGMIGLWSITEKKCLISYTTPPFQPQPLAVDQGASRETDTKGPPAGSAEPMMCFIALSRDQRTIALSQGHQLRVFHIENQALLEFVTIREGIPAQPVFSLFLSAETTDGAADGDYLYWGSWILDLGEYDRDHHRYLSKGSTAEVQHSYTPKFSSLVGHPASLLCVTEMPTRITSYHLRNDAGILLLPTDMDICCWVSFQTKIALGTADGRVVLVHFKDWGILEDQRSVAREPADGREVLPRDITSEVTLISHKPKYSTAYSNVYQGKLNGITVAIKEIKPLSGVGQKSMRRKVAREMTVWAQLHHPNILSFCGFIQDDDYGEYGAFVSLWCNAGNARVYMEGHGGSLDLSDRISLWRDVIAGVSYLHNHRFQIVHGDLKPENVLIDDDGIPLICDFGQVRVEDAHPSLMTSNTHGGTERYLALELLDGRELYPTRESDIYAVGCIGLMFAWGRQPYQNYGARHLGDISRIIREGTPPAIPPGEMSPLDGKLWDLLEKSWSPEPECRPTASGLLAQVEELTSIL